MKLLFVTNMTAPYRHPVWDTMAAANQLDVWLLHAAEGGGSVSASRSRDWQVTGNHDWRTRHLDTAVLSRGEANYYVIRPQERLDLRDYDAVILGGWESPAYWQLAVAARRRHIPVVVFYESTLASASFTSGPISWARSVFLRWADRVVVPGVASRRAVERYGVQPAHIHQGFNAVDVQRFAAHNPASQTTTDGESTTSGPVRIAYFGQLIPRKNIDSLIRAFAAMNHRAELHVYGDGPEGPALQELSDQLGLGPRVTFEGFVPYDELPSAMSSNDILALVSTQEVWGLVVNEALATGLGVVVSDSCGVSESVKAMRGVVVTATDQQAITEALDEATGSWRGHVAEPEILDHTPEKLAGTLLSAVESAMDK